MHFDFENGTFGHLRHAPQAAAIVHAGGALSWQTLHAQTRSWIQRALGAGARTEHALVILGHNEPAIVTAMLGCLVLGVPYVPADSRDNVDRIRRIVDHACASLIYDTATDRFIVGPAGARTLTERRLACIMFSAAGGHEPLGAQIGRESISAQAKWLRRQAGLGAAPVFMGPASFMCGRSILDLLGPMATGGTLVLRPATDEPQSGSYAEHLARHGVSVLVAKPAFLRQQLLHPDFDGRRLPALHTLILGAEPITPPHFLALRQRFPAARIIRNYDRVEVTGAATWSEIDASMHDPLANTYTLGHARSCGEVFLRNGEICVAGPTVMRGYINAPEINRMRLFQHRGRPAYRTGHWGMIDERGLVYWQSQAGPEDAAAAPA
ncbi:AMP-binding protein [Bordetella genomosp. 1]|uniref:AMP-dependent synthetase/ligase domain-containing protein n=1 Tax=Bordetella genomosp. 1 TaxID=1395607 RepID=A0ABX4EWJ7_9BORD|nr:AMP-binding protein [Bordetella genomosp. 1]OZI58846.1 hypothetical protein CAL27_19425 [Bordetella genomosp. 1]